MLMEGCPLWIRRRFSSTEASHFFFQPVQLDLQLPDLLVEVVGERFLLLVLFDPLVREDGGQAFEELTLPLHQQVRMHLGVAGDLVERALALDHFQGQLGLEFRRVTVALCLHRRFPFSQILTQPTTLYRCPNSWGHYTGKALCRKRKSYFGGFTPEWAGLRSALRHRPCVTKRAARQGSLPSGRASLAARADACPTPPW